MVLTLGPPVAAPQRKAVGQKHRRQKGFMRLFHQVSKYLLLGVHILGREDGSYPGAGKHSSGETCADIALRTSSAQAGAFGHSAYLPHSPVRSEDPMSSMALAVSKESA